MKKNTRNPSKIKVKKDSTATDSEPRQTKPKERRLKKIFGKFLSRTGKKSSSTSRESGGTKSKPSVRRRNAQEKAKQEKTKELSEKTCRSFKKGAKGKHARSRTSTTDSPIPLAKSPSVTTLLVKKRLDEVAQKSGTQAEKTQQEDVEKLEKGVTLLLDEAANGKTFRNMLNEIWEEVESIEFPDDKCKAFLANMERNQSEEVECLDANRIKLEGTNNDYYHASFMELKNVNRKLILCQLPKLNHREDFWTMVYQNSVHSMYILCHPEESTKTGADRFGEYFPLSNGQHEYYGQIWVHNRKTEVAKEGENGSEDLFVIEVLPQGCAESVLVTVHLCCYWPDGEIPANRKNALKTAKFVFGNSDSYENDPIAIVSKNGAGRTGTFVAMMSGLHLLMNGLPINVKEWISSIRNQRPGAIDTECQFIFVFVSILSFSNEKVQNKDLKTRLEKTLHSLENYLGSLLREDSTECGTAES